MTDHDRDHDHDRNHDRDHDHDRKHTRQPPRTPAGMADHEHPRLLGDRARTVVVYPGNLGSITHTPTPKEEARLPETFERLWHVNDPDFDAITRHCPSRGQQVMTAIRACPRAADIHAEAKTARAPRDVARVLGKLAQVALSPAARRECKTTAYTSVGNAGELPALNDYARMSGSVVRQPHHRFTMICLVDPRRYVVEVRGRVDGIVLARDEGGVPGVGPRERVDDPSLWQGAHIRTVVEAKTRTHMLYGKPSTNERVQLEMYLQILGTTRGVLVERLGGQNTIVHHYTRSDEFYAKLMGALARFMDVFVDFLEDAAARARYTTLTHGRKILAIVHMVEGRHSPFLFPGRGRSALRRRCGKQAAAVVSLKQLSESSSGSDSWLGSP